MSQYEKHNTEVKKFFFFATLVTIVASLCGAGLAPFAGLLGAVYFVVKFVRGLNGSPK